MGESIGGWADGRMGEWEGRGVGGQRGVSGTVGGLGSGYTG